MNIIIKITPYFEVEKKYIINWFFSTLKIKNVDIKVHNSNKYEILINNKKIFLPDSFFINAKNNWLKEESVPRKTFKINLPNSFIKKFNINYLFSIHDTNETKFELNQESINIPIDLFGNAFFFITRYHEFVFKDKVDEHKRHLSKNSFINHNFQEPIIDQYLNFLKEILNIFLFKKISYVSSKFQISCDVDTPYDRSEKKFFLIKKKIFKKNFFLNLDKNLKSLTNYLFSKLKIYNYDIFNTYEWIMKQNEKKNHKVTFFFISKNKDKFDSFYSLEEDRIKKILKLIDYRGHNIGLHGSYMSYNDEKKLSEEKKILETSLEKLKIKTPIEENRFHFLRWSNSSSINALEKSGFNFDSSIYYADQPGYRSGTSKNFNLFDLNKSKISNVIEKPLTMMDVSLFDKNYLNLKSTKDVNQYIDMFFKILKSNNCDFNLLWHNSTLLSKEEKDFYKKILLKLDD